MYNITFKCKIWRWNGINIVRKNTFNFLLLLTVEPMIINGNSITIPLLSFKDKANHSISFKKPCNYETRANHSISFKKPCNYETRANHRVSCKKPWNSKTRPTAAFLLRNREIENKKQKYKANHHCVFLLRNKIKKYIRTH